MLRSSNRRGRQEASKRPRTVLGLEGLEERVVPSAVATIQEATGPDVAAIQSTVDAFRADLGNNNTNVEGSFGGGRRQINWDGAPDAVSAPNSFPGDFFNANVSPRARGAVFFNAEGGGFQLSNNDIPADFRFGNLNATYTTAFATFSSPRLFTPIGSNVTEVEFFIPGTSIPATTRGFGAVFTDVDDMGSAQLEFFDIDGNQIFQRDILATPGNGSLSFLGATFTSSSIARVRITSGTAALGPDDVTQGGSEDVVALDDFIYGEPVAFNAVVPEGPQVVNQNGTLIFSNSNGNALSIEFQNLITDGVSPDSPVEVHLSASNGTLTLADTTGLAFSEGDGSTDLQTTFTGTVANVNAALDGLAYTPTPGFLGEGGVNLEIVDVARTSSVPIEVGINGRSDGPGVFDPATGMWYLRNTPTAGFPDIGPFAYGAPGWAAVAGDYNGDGVDTIGVVDNIGTTSPTEATWFLRNSNSPGAPDFGPFEFGLVGWIPVIGDWDGDGVDTIGIFDPATATWYLRNSNSPGAVDFPAFSFGPSAALPIVGDWDGDGTDTIGVFDTTSGQFFLRNSNDSGAPDAGNFAYGLPNWLPVAGDWDGDGSDSIGVIDPTGASDTITGQGEVWFLRNSLSSGAPDYTTFPYGNAGWQPVVGNWSFTGDPVLSVEVENLNLDGGPFLTPVWFALHDGSFDLYNLGEPASPALERLAEDGNFRPLGELLRSMQPNALAGAIPGPAGAMGPLDPGETNATEFAIQDGSAVPFFSFASMVVPSNDAFLASPDDPQAIQLFDNAGNFLGPVNLILMGNDVLDAGTEVNNEVPEQTAFLAQTMPNTGVDENGVVAIHPGYIGSQRNPGGTPVILGGEPTRTGEPLDPTIGDFTRNGGNVPMLQIRIRQLPPR